MTGEPDRLPKLTDEPRPAFDDVAATTDLAVLNGVCRVIGYHVGEGRIVGRTLVGRCAYCGLGIATDGV